MKITDTNGVKAFLQLICLALIMLTGACQGAKSGVPEGENELKEASFLRIYRQGDAEVAVVLNPTDTASVLATYIFPDTDDSEVPQIEGAVVLKPSDLKKLLVYSGVHASALQELKGVDRITQVGDAEYFTIPEIKEGLKSCKIADVGTQQAPVTEKIISDKPGAILLSYYPGMDDSALKKLGVPIVYLAESMENTPLGRAEWIKFMGLLSGNRQGADLMFGDVSREYADLVRVANGVKSKPKVLTETMYQGVWNVPGGRSYAARLIADAGGEYIWADDSSTGALNLPFEAVLAKASDADIWLMRVFGTEVTTDWLAGNDERYMLFAPAKAVKQGDPSRGIWACNTATTFFFEETPYHPERLLRDYISIFHPETIRQKPHYFKKVER